MDQELGIEPDTGRQGDQNISTQVLGLGIEAHLEPTAEWIRSLGLSQTQVAKVIRTFPQVLGYSLEANLEPTVEWIRSLGLSQTQVAKVIRTFPHALGLSVETNLKSKVEWIRSLGLSRTQVAQVIRTFPQVLSLSIEANLRFKHALLCGYFPGQCATAVFAQHPQLWGYCTARLQRRLDVLNSHNELSKLPRAMAMPLHTFNRRFPDLRRSIASNVKTLWARSCRGFPFWPA